jgi:16S rRNA (cytosine967-C5)-methyltransferase
VPWLKHPADIAKLAEFQGRLLARAAALTKEGGTLVYCTCSLEPEEGKDVVAGLLARETSFRRAPLRDGEIPGIGGLIDDDGDLRTLPCHFPNPDARFAGLDGFFAARLVKH